MKNFIKNNFYSIQEIIDKAYTFDKRFTLNNPDDIKDEDVVYVFKRFGLLLVGISYLILFGFLIYYFIMWNFNGYEVILRALLISIIFNILILKK